MRRLIRLVEAAERAALNNLGRPIAPTQQGLANFWTWFGRSKLITREGRPIVVYHGTKADFRAFDPGKSNGNTGTGVPRGVFVFTSSTDAAQSYAGQKTEDWGFPTERERLEWQHLLLDLDDVEGAARYFKAHAVRNVKTYTDGGNVMPVYLRMLRPLRVNARGESWRNIYYQGDDWDTNHLMQYAKDHGYDGLIVRNVHDRQEGSGKACDVFAVFSPAQIKSAIGNNGSFDWTRTPIDEIADCDVAQMLVPIL